MGSSNKKRSNNNKKEHKAALTQINNNVKTAKDKNNGMSVV